MHASDLRSSATSSSQIEHAYSEQWQHLDSTKDTLTVGQELHHNRQSGQSQLTDRAGLGADSDRDDLTWNENQGYAFIASHTLTQKTMVTFAAMMKSSLAMLRSAMQHAEPKLHSVVMPVAPMC